MRTPPLRRLAPALAVLMVGCSAGPEGGASPPAEPVATVDAAPPPAPKGKASRRRGPRRPTVGTDGGPMSGMNTRVD